MEDMFKDPAWQDPALPPLPPGGASRSPSEGFGAATYGAAALAASTDDPFSMMASSRASTGEIPGIFRAPTCLCLAFLRQMPSRSERACSMAELRRDLLAGGEKSIQNFQCREFGGSGSGSVRDNCCFPGPHICLVILVGVL